MYKLCKTEQSTRRQRQIETCLLSLLESKPFDSISVTELCEKCQMPRKAFYRYFDSKEGALYALIEHTYQSYGGLAVGKDAKKRSLSEEMTEFFLFWQGQQRLLDALSKSDLLPKLLEVSLSFPVTEFLSVSKFLPSETPWERIQIFKYTVGGLLLLMLDWYKRGFKESAAAMGSVATKILGTQLFSKLDEIGL